MGSSNIVAWADGYTNYLIGADVAETWQIPENALGAAAGTSIDIVCLGRSGEITLTFTHGIADGAGADFVVFENSFSDTFLELGWVEVSSDGEHFVRFPNFSYTVDPVGGFGQVDATFIYGYAGKYIQGYGTPFDLSELQITADEIAAEGSGFSEEYMADFNRNFPYLNVSLITHVKIIDINGDGSSFDSNGYHIYDPFKTIGSAGFDLDAIGVMNEPFDDRISQTIEFPSIPNQSLDFKQVELSAAASSGLPVDYVVTGPATLSGHILTFTGPGIVEVSASQLGDLVYAPASVVLRSFHVAEAIQHIFIEPIPNQQAANTTIQVHAYASSGLPVSLEIYSGPDGVVVDSTNHVVTLTNEVDQVTLRASQEGDSTTASAEDVYVSFQLTTNPPILFSEWQVSNAVPEAHIQASEDAYGRPAITLQYVIDPQVLMRTRVMMSKDLVVWTNTVPDVLSIDEGEISVQMSAEDPHGFYRLEFEEQ